MTEGSIVGGEAGEEMPVHPAAFSPKRSGNRVACRGSFRKISKGGGARVQ